MIRAAWAISIACLLAGTASSSAQEGRLQRVRDDVNAPSTSSSEGKEKGRSSSSSSSSSDEDGDNLGGAMFKLAVLAPFYVPMAILGDEYEYRLVFTRYPYANNYHGYQIMLPDWAKTFYTLDTADVPRKQWVMRLSVENGNDFDGMNRLGGQLKIEHAWRWGFVTNWNYFRERLPCGCIDEAVIGDANLTFRFAQNEVASMYAGLGFRVLSDRRQTDFGVNFTYGGDWFPVRPLVVSGVFDAGNLGSAGVVHARGSVGAIWNAWEVFAGYDFLRIGSVNLQGPMVGVRLWF